MTGMIALLLTALAGAADTPPGVDARADEAMRKMAAYLKTANRFSFTAEETYDLEVARA